MDITRQKEYLTSARWLCFFSLAHMFLRHLWAQWVRALGKEAKDGTGHRSKPWSLVFKAGGFEEIISKVSLSFLSDVTLSRLTTISIFRWSCPYLPEGAASATAVLRAVGLGSRSVEGSAL